MKVVVVHLMDIQELVIKLELAVVLALVEEVIMGLERMHQMVEVVDMVVIIVVVLV